MSDQPLPLKELDEVLEDLVTLLKNPDVGAELTARGVNVSLAIVGAEGLAAYVHGDKERAADDLLTVGEEIKSRLAQSGSEEKPS
ncbi:MAG: hypothetical protein BGO98_48480 [Myxococcales bacterium 68-20]|nr:MAG: hypothetical protein BGO98_48480 [Myxococcales bacterium 68-20]